MKKKTRERIFIFFLLFGASLITSSLQSINLWLIAVGLGILGIILDSIIGGNKK
jgi:hypothetical protein